MLWGYCWGSEDFRQRTLDISIMSKVIQVHSHVFLWELHLYVTTYSKLQMKGVLDTRGVRISRHSHSQENRSSGRIFIGGGVALFSVYPVFIFEMVTSPARKWRQEQRKWLVVLRKNSRRLDVSELTALLSENQRQCAGSMAVKPTCGMFHQEKKTPRFIVLIVQDVDDYSWDSP